MAVTTATTIVGIHSIDASRAIEQANGSAERSGHIGNGCHRQSTGPDKCLDLANGGPVTGSVTESCYRFPPRARPYASRTHLTLTFVPPPGDPTETLSPARHATIAKRKAVTVVLGNVLCKAAQPKSQFIQRPNQTLGWSDSLQQAYF